MSNYTKYTESLLYDAETLSLNDDIDEDYDAETLSWDDDIDEKKLCEIAARFRGFDKALTAFIEKHGYIGKRLDILEKVKFLQEKFKTANVKLPCDSKMWFDSENPKKPERETSFQICFAFGLSVMETNDFFRRVWLGRSFDCHTINEAVYYFCMKNGFSYKEAQTIIKRIPKPDKVKVIPKDREVMHTETITQYIDRIEDKEKLIQYITDNIDDFQYNNVTAIKYVKELWTKISRKAESQSENGEEYNLAVREGKIIDKYNQNENESENRVVVKDNASTWDIFCQIIGLDNHMKNKYKHNRSIVSVLSENVLMPMKADYCFPSRQRIDQLLRGEPPHDNEAIRKMLILLVFYTHWVKIIIDNKNAYYQASHSDAERCLYTINKRLLDADYPELYPGNPYDWIFMWALNDDHPLQAFRTYMGEVFAVKSEPEPYEE